MANKLKNIIKFSKKNRDTLYIIALCNQKHQYYNFINHLGEFFINKYRKYKIDFNLYEPKKMKLEYLEGLHSYPVFTFYKREDREIYHGINSNEVEKIILEMVR